MQLKFKVIPGSITTPLGFRAAGVFCDIKQLGTGKGSDKGRKRDLALLVSDVPATVAGLFTTNQVSAAPVKISAARAEQGIAQAVVANSGNANACTGAPGLKDAERMTLIAARRLNLAPEQVLACSTGRIGLRLPMDRVKQGIEAAAPLLSADAQSGHDLAEAIMTTDTRPKEVAVELQLGGKTARIAGVCKGAGMIQPGMSLTGARPAARPLHATMLCFITTDAAATQPALRAALTEAVAQSFNRITVDGDMSTNDSVILLANGQAGNAPLNVKAAGRADLARFQEALNHVALELAKMIVRDGEGASRFITVRLKGAQSFTDADTAARAVANSPLVRTSWYGGDPNWGRIMGALGYSSAKIVEAKVDIGYSEPGGRKILYALKAGRATTVKMAALKRLTELKEFDVHINLNLGTSQAVIYSADLTEEYVDFNKGE
jgi:glutamate N-acetyltransferase / amino-acid N-acetyltransferase